jgi:hypothetical protein
MITLSLRAFRANGTHARLASLLAMVGLLLSFTVIASAQDPKPNKPKVAVVPKTPDTPSSNSVAGPMGFASIERPTVLINEYLAKAWKDNKIQPAARCDDYEFIRRASLDIIGRIATLAELERYLRDPPETRRGLLLERLLYDKEGGKEGSAAMRGNPDYVRNWATLWTNWMMTRTATDLHRRQLHRWLEDVFSAEDQSHKTMVTMLMTAKGKTNEAGEVNFILAHLGGMKPGASFAEGGAFDAVPITARSMRLFLGYQVQCAQCHDSFVNDWKQKHFWGVNAFFLQVERVGQPQMQQSMQNVVLELRDNPGYNVKGVVSYEKVRTAVMQWNQPVFLPEKGNPNGRRIPADSKLTRREELARFLTGHENFNQAYVNRMWGHLFGRGLNVSASYDDFGTHNEVVHPELLAKLGDAFASMGNHDPRRLIKWICSSDAYNLKAAVTEANVLQGKEAFPVRLKETEPYFTHMLQKTMTPEQLLESLLTATKPAANNAAGIQAQQNLRNQWLGVLIRNFGDDEGNELSYNGTILQALLMMNGKDMNDAINNSGTVKEAQKLAANPKAFLDYLSRATLNRPTTPKEAERLLAILRQGPGGEAAMQDILWVLLNCNEFILNH